MWPFSPAYPQKSSDSLEHEYDFIIAGGGTAGCVLARRLSDSGKYTVLLVERGDAADGWLHRTPLTSFHFVSNGKHSSVFDSSPDTTLGRSYSLISGIGLGGSTRINGGQYTCGVPAEYNSWKEEGREGWGYHDLKPYFLKSESWTGPVPKDWHGAYGPLSVRSFEHYFCPASQKTAEAANVMGFAPILDMHSPLEPPIGWNKMQFALNSQGQRQSSFRAYLPRKVALERQRILHICTSTVVTKLDITGHPAEPLRAESVEVRAANGKGPTRSIEARREIIVTCGALQTPQILLLRHVGLGPASHLEHMGIEVAKDLPGVGTYLQDHLLVPTSYYCPIQDSLWGMIRNPLTLLIHLFLYLWYGTGWLLCAVVELEIFGMSSVVRSDGKLDSLTKEQTDPYDPKNRPDFAVMACAIADPRGPGVNRSRGMFGLNGALLEAKSHGVITLKSRDPFDHPVCDMRYLTEPEDWLALRASLRVAAELGRVVRAAGYPLEAFSAPEALDDASLDEYIKQKVDTMYHYSSSCRMAPLSSDLNPGVVDDYLRVHGVPNLRIADASIFPTVPTAHPQAVVYAVAEKCADMILASNL